MEKKTKLTGEEAIAILEQIGWTREDRCFFSCQFTEQQMRRFACAMVDAFRKFDRIEECLVAAVELLAEKVKAELEDDTCKTNSSGY